jgi:hypothetical protein
MRVSRRNFGLSVAAALLADGTAFAQDEEPPQFPEDGGGGSGEGGGDESGGGGDSTLGGGDNPGGGGGFSNGPAEPGAGIDPVNDSTGGRMSEVPGVQLATNDPTRDMTDTGWGNIFDVSNPENSCLVSGANDLAADAHAATEVTPDEFSFWSDKWFNFSASFVIGDSANGAVQTDVEMTKGYVTAWVPVEGEGGVFYTQDTDYSAAGVYAGLPNEAEIFGQTELSTPAPNIEFGVRIGPGELTLGVDAGPMVESGGRALENIERNLYDFYSPGNFGY